MQGYFQVLAKGGLCLPSEIPTHLHNTLRFSTKFTCAPLTACLLIC